MLFDTIKEIQEYISIGAGNDFNRLKPHIDNAETKYIKTLIGADMYEELLVFKQNYPYPDPDEIQQVTTKLLKKVRNATIHLAYYLGFDLLNISITDAGFHRTESTHTKGLYKYQEDRIRNYFAESGFNELDNILLFLEENIGYFGKYKNSSNWTAYKESFLPTVKSVTDIPFQIYNSRLILLALQPHIGFVEDTVIRPLLGNTIYKQIKSEMLKENPDENILAIIPYIQKPLIYLSAAQLMEQTGSILGNKGLYFESVQNGYQNDTKKEPSGDKNKSAMISLTRQRGLSYLESLKSFLVSSGWEEYSGGTGPLINRNNTGKKTFWA